jgi:hypothetical protein
MAVNLNPLLKDPAVVPSEEIIMSMVGESINLWKSVLNYATGINNDVSGEWRYYNDGKQWLFKLVHKKKTIFWAGIFDNTFRITFYFGDKAEPLIEQSDLPSRIIDEYKNGKRFGSIRGISIRLTEHSDMESVYKLINIKRKIK